MSGTRGDLGGEVPETVANIPYTDAATADAVAELWDPDANRGEPDGLAQPLKAKIVSSVLWRSGSQMTAQVFAWAVTFVTIRILSPEDYGVVAMSQTVLVLLSMLSGGSFANALIQKKTIEKREVAQVYGLLILLNLVLILIQLALAPIVAAYYRHPVLADVLRVQALIYVAMPCFSLGTALLAQRLEYRKLALSAMVSVIISAGVALASVLAGLGIWTLVLAPLAMFWSRAVLLAFAARLRLWPSFNFRGAQSILGFGGAVIASQLLWFVQSQSDIFIGGRYLDAETLGFYTTALFLTQIVTAKILPAINDVAYSAYARIHHDGVALSGPFIQSVRWVMMVVLPLYFGLAMTAEPVVSLVLGDHWRGSAPIIAILAVAMPAYALQLVFPPATNAVGRPRLALYAALAGAVLMPAGYGIGLQWGVIGLASAWLVTSPLLLMITAALSLPVLKTRPAQLLAAVAPPLLASLGMLIPIALVRMALVGQPAWLSLVVEVATGGGTYIALLWLVARDSILSFFDTLRRRGKAG